MNELDLFATAVAVADSHEREALLDRQCAGRPDLRSRIDRLLAAHFKSHPLLDRPPPDGAGGRAALMDCVSWEVAGVVIAGKYKLQQRVGEGGMGSVWMADQTEPIRRKVAVKLIHVERGQSQTILARFEAERQAIALMDHPHIARLLDAGTTETGSPFFVMELVKGVPLTDFCDTHKLNIPQRLALFIQICSAVQHAHLKGIIHRDLKPTNILVESHDGKPVPKVIDFGLAKAATGLKLSERTVFTAFGSVMGTPQYMAPEQATFNALDVDTRADIYALGVVLYELLTGTTPLTRATIKQTHFDEVLKLIREQEAPTPSSRLSSSESQPSVAANRQMEPVRLGHFVRGELDWIVLKALSKERERRYETASGFGRDVERFLNHEAVTAGPPTAAYRLRKFVRRNRPQVIAACLVLLALVAGVIGTTLGLLAANRATEAERTAKDNALEQKRLAGRAEKRERKAKVEAKAKREEAERNLAFAKKGNEILGSVFAGLDPKQIAESGRPLQEVLRQNLTQAVRELEGSAIGGPLEVAEMQNTLGNSLLGLGEGTLAIEVFKKALDTRKARLGPDHPDTLASMNNLAIAYEAGGQLAKAVPLYEEALDKQKTQLGPEHLNTLNTMNNLAGTYLVSGQLTKAVLLYEETLEKRKAALGPIHWVTLQGMNNLAVAYKESGQLTKAMPLFEETLHKQKTHLGPEHPETLQSMNNLAMAHQASGQLTKAVPLFEETLEKRKATLGPDHRDTLLSMHHLAMAYQERGQLAKAVSLYDEALQKQKTRLGPEHPDTLGSMYDLVWAYVIHGDLEKVVPLLEETLKKRNAQLGPEHADTTNATPAETDTGGQLAKVVSLLEETLEQQKARLGPHHFHIRRLKETLAFAFKLQSLELTARAAATKGPKHIDTLIELRHVAEKHLAFRQPDLAEPLLVEVLDALAVGPNHSTRVITIEVLRQTFKLRTEMAPDSWATFNTQSRLGGALMGQRKYAEAEPLLLSGYEGMKAREATIPRTRGGELSIPQAVDRLIELYTATNKPEEAKRWQVERAKYPETRPTGGK